jgi:hypothetical protein
LQSFNVALHPGLRRHRQSNQERYRVSFGWCFGVARRSPPRCRPLPGNGGQAAPWRRSSAWTTRPLRTSASADAKLSTSLGRVPPPGGGHDIVCIA